MGKRGKPLGADALAALALKPGESLDVDTERDANSARHAARGRGLRIKMTKLNGGGYRLTMVGAREGGAR